MKRTVLYNGLAVNLKTGKTVDFQIPHSLSRHGLESIQKNMKIIKLTPSKEVSHLLGLLQEYKTPWTSQMLVYNPRTGRPEYDCQADPKFLALLRKAFNTYLIDFKEAANVLRIVSRFMLCAKNDQKNTFPTLS